MPSLTRGCLPCYRSIYKRPPIDYLVSLSVKHERHLLIAYSHFTILGVRKDQLFGIQVETWIVVDSKLLRAQEQAANGPSAGHNVLPKSLNSFPASRLISCELRISLSPNETYALLRTLIPSSSSDVSMVCLARCSFDNPFLKLNPRRVSKSITEARQSKERMTWIEKVQSNRNRPG
jgi:hypothetical protein